MNVGVRELRNQTRHVIDAVRAGEPVTLTVYGKPIADIVPHRHRTRWLSGPNLERELQTRAADADLTGELDELTGHTWDKL
jgi:prevent-host-death family protein